MRRFAVMLAVALAAVARGQVDGDPLYVDKVETNGASFYAWRPFYSSSVGDERWRKDYFWPLYTKKGFKEERYSRFLFFGYHTDFKEDDDRHRVWVIPFYFKGTSKDGEDYLAVWPFGGSIYEFLGRDKVSFVLWPFYVKSHINDVHSTSVLWPIGSRTEGEGIDRFRVWPFYSRAALEGEFTKKSIMWPIWHEVQYTNERNPGGGFILVPIYGRIKTERADNYWVVAPFFRFFSSPEQWIVHAPWPFVQLADGEMKKRIFWPFYGKKSLGTLTRQYWFWPILWNNKTEYAVHEQRRRFVMPFFTHQTDVITKPTVNYEPGDVISKYWKLWPLMSWERNFERSRFRTIELWPMRDTPGVERNWAPWWTLYQRLNKDGEVGHHVLWGLYRQTRSDERFEWSLLKGLVGYKKIENQRRYRALFMWLGDDEEETP